MARWHARMEGIGLMSPNWAHTTRHVVWGQVCFYFYYLFLIILLTYIFIIDSSTMQQHTPTEGIMPTGFADVIQVVHSITTLLP